MLIIDTDGPFSVSDFELLKLARNDKNYINIMLYDENGFPLCCGKIKVKDTLKKQVDEQEKTEDIEKFVGEIS